MDVTTASFAVAVGIALIDEYTSAGVHVALPRLAHVAVELVGFHGFCQLHVGSGDVDGIDRIFVLLCSHCQKTLLH